MTHPDLARVADFRRNATLERIRTLAATSGNWRFAQEGVAVTVWWDQWFADRGLPVDEGAIRDAIELAYAGMNWKL